MKNMLFPVIQCDMLTVFLLYMYTLHMYMQEALTFFNSLICYKILIHLFLKEYFFPIRSCYLHVLLC